MTDTIQIRAGDIGVLHRPRLSSRVIHYGTRRGMLGLTVGPLMVVACLLWWANPWMLATLGVWMVASVRWLEEPTRWDHALMFVEGGPLETARTAEAWVGKGMTLATRGRDGWPREAEIWRPCSLTDEQRLMTVQALRNRLGMPYSMRTNVAFGLDYMLGLGLWDAYVFRRWWLDDDDLTCSTYTAVALWTAVREGSGRDFGVGHWRQVSPDTIGDFCASHPTHYELVAERRDGIWS